jgi:hypothetical protein
MMSKFNGFFLLILVVACLFGAGLIYMHPDRQVDVAVAVLGTFLAAWAGGWAAFAAERRTNEDAERKACISAANKAIFTISSMFGVFENLHQFYMGL